ncbi:MAG: Holliday junction resolvase RuvX [Bacilli bacterium]|nr:Holliday junction resolvase RuvX [Bacilli bacterium]
MKYLGLDLGSKTLGIAISDASNTIASVLKTIRFSDEDYQSLIEPLKEILINNDVKTVVLGYPLNMNGTVGVRAEICLKFKEMLEEQLNVSVVMEDERLTSVISNQILIEADLSRKKRKKKVDGLAAQIILQSYLDRKGGIKNER